jgi:hypothetical protein
MLRKIIATGVTGLGIFAVAMVSPAMPAQNGLQDQISDLIALVQAQIARDEERFRRIEADIRRLTPSSDNIASIPPNSVQPITVRPTINVRPIINVQPPRHRHYYPRYVWCPPEWWGWGPPY